MKKNAPNIDLKKRSENGGPDHHLVQKAQKTLEPSKTIYG